MSIQPKRIAKLKSTAGDKRNAQRPKASAQAAKLASSVKSFDDCRWFAEHPDEGWRLRRASALELAAYELPARSRMYVFHVSETRVFRMPALPIDPK